MPHIAFLGCAHIHTPGFIKMLQAHPEIKIKSIYDYDHDRATKRAQELSATATDLPAILSDPEINAVIIASETNRHEELVTKSAAAKKHMFVEKPLGMGARDSNLMAAAIEKSGVLFQTGYFRRSDPMHQFLRSEIQKGTFGKITRIRGSNCHSGALGGWFNTDWRWMADPKQAGCGAFGDLGTHSLDIMIWLLGEITSVTATLDSGTARYPNCDETGEAVMRFKNGAIGTLAAAWDDIANPVQLLISGTQAHAAIINNQLFFQSKTIEAADGKQPWTALPAPWPHAFEIFLDAITHKHSGDLVTAREAAYRSTVMESIYKSADSRAWINL